jgi:hypothetical protein
MEERSAYQPAGLPLHSYAMQDSSIFEALFSQTVLDKEILFSGRLPPKI